MSNKKIKQSLFLGALTSSFGFFLSKLIGLFYYSPLSDLAGEANMYFYSTVYKYYDVILQISSAGIPFAIAALVAKYLAKNDYKTVLLIKKLGTSIVIALSLVMGILLILIAEPFAKFHLGSLAPAKDIDNLKNLFLILSVAVISCPILSAFRGYSQGLKRLDIYASSQVLEQFVRVFSILLFGYIFVRLLKFDSFFAIQIAIAAASLGAIVALVYCKFFSKEDEQHILELAKEQDFDIKKTHYEVINEILTLGIPYLLISFLSTAAPLINGQFLGYMTKIHGGAVYESAKLSAGILEANIGKLSNIPSVLAMGFSSSIVPYLSESLEEKNNKKISLQINQILEAVLYILVPVIVVFIFFAKDIYYIMYGNSNLDLGASLFSLSNIQIFLGTIAPVFSSIMMSLNLRKQAFLTLIISVLIKFITFYPCVRFFGVNGMIYSSGFYYLFQICMYLHYLSDNYGINIKKTLRRFVSIGISSLVMIIPAIIIHMLIPFDYSSRIMDIAIMGFLGLLMVVIYYLFTVWLKIPQRVFAIEDISLKKLLRKIR